ncbi:protein of unknown function [Clostridium cavendishii DSM 21758]|uniref:DUF4351 domain-containing protein n=1 Tax=Clostridium cavendishii DSM 21758 TaxID=1121302 RepID=A0A1M6GKG0_9CLOT|nr:DUF4351 domain-containing protein [Clostridium cavendishii]SHJ10410.1 protein of unknown function [Clostridium cavendishii DSM 21758]
MDYNKVEDAVFKKAMEIFKDSASEFFNLDVKLKKPAQTEIKNIDIKTSAMDYLFYTETDDYLHFEFQTTDKRDDIARFLYYDASLHYMSRKNIRTVVVYSSDIKDVVTNINCGSINYTLECFYMSKLNGDENYERIKTKVDNGEELTEQDIMTLSFIPLMESEKSKSDITLDSIEIAKDIKNEEEKTKCLTLLYALFDKFGDEKAKKRFKEVVSMTDVGRMIYEEGKEEGISIGEANGETKGKADLLLKQLIRRFKKLPDGYREKILNLKLEQIEVIAGDIFELEKVEDLEQYF